MNRLPALLSLACTLALCACGHLEMSSVGDSSRVLSGEVVLADAAALPPDATVTVRVVDLSAGMPPQVLGAQTIASPGQPPVAFRVEYHADDEALRKGLNVEARVSFGGRVRYFNLNQYAVTLSNATDSHRISVNPSGP